jgi:hypothetical protein
LLAWRLQTIGKRRTDLAEEALLAFDQAVDALSAARSMMGFSSEDEAMRASIGRESREQEPGDEFRVILWRISQHQEKFSALRKTQLLCGYHFGAGASEAFARLHQARTEVVVAARMLVATAREMERIPYRSPEQAEQKHEQRQKWEQTVWEGYGTPDAIAEAVTVARTALDRALSPHLRADAAFLPVATEFASRLRERMARGRQRHDKF